MIACSWAEIYFCWSQNVCLFMCRFLWYIVCILGRNWIKILSECFIHLSAIQSDQHHTFSSLIVRNLQVRQWYYIGNSWGFLVCKLFSCRIIHIIPAGYDITSKASLPAAVTTNWYLLTKLLQYSSCLVHAFHHVLIFVEFFFFQNMKFFSLFNHRSIFKMDKCCASWTCNFASTCWCSYKGHEHIGGLLSSCSSCIQVHMWR